MTAPIKFLSLLCLFAATTDAFAPTHQQRFLTSLKAKIDAAKIKDAASHFGKYSLEEVAEIKNELHKERIQNLALNRNAVTGEQATEQRLMEQELDLQLNLLKRETKSTSQLFPDEMVTDLPHLKGGSAAVVPQQETNPSAKPDDFYMKELFMEENVIETIAFCSFLALLMVAPNILR